MSNEIDIRIDGAELKAEPGRTIMEVADDADIYIPRLCRHPDLPPHGSCRVCTVKVNGKFMAACTTPVEPKMDVVTDDPEIKDLRSAVIEMLFVEGNHYCMFCEMSGKCELQAVAYRLGMLVPRYPFMFPRREVDASHPGVLLDRNRCIQCGRCVQTSRDHDHKHVFELVERGLETRLSVDSDTNLAATDLSVADRSLGVCPVGAIIVKDTAFRIPIGQRPYDKAPIGSDIAGRE